MNAYEKKEHSCSWVNADDLDSVNLFENHRKMLEAALAMEKNKNKVKKIEHSS